MKTIFARFLPAGLASALAFLTFGVALAILTACGSYQLTELEKLRVGSAASDYAARLDATLVGCSGQDSDRDGYVSCDLSNDTAIVCSYGEQSGCKRKTAALRLKDRDRAFA